MSMMVQPYAFAAGGGGGPSFANVAFLSGWEGADAATAFTDESSYARALTAVGNAQLDTAQKKFGSSSLLLDGTGDVVTSPNSASLGIGANPFQMDAWVRFASAGVIHAMFMAQEYGWRFWLTGGNLAFSFNDTGGNTRQAFGAWAPAQNTWHHVRADRDATKIRTYADGVMLGSGTISQTELIGGDLFRVGAHASNPAYSINGWLDETRVVIGEAPEASDSGYTVPTAAFPRS